MASKFEAVIESCKAQMKAQGIPCNADLLEKVAKSLGPSIYNRDASTVAASQKSELETIVTKFIGKKLGVKDEAKANAAIEYAIEKIGSSNRSKKRVVFYYLIVKKLKKESVFQ